MGSMETPFELVTCICNSANESAMNQLFNIKKNIKQHQILTVQGPLLFFLHFCT